MKEVSAQRLLEVRICQFAQCPEEADTGSDYCRRHRNGSGAAAADLAALGREFATTTRQEEPMKCKIEGCERERNTRYDRGPYAGLCEEVHIPARREEISRRERDRRASLPQANGDLEPGQRERVEDGIFRRLTTTGQERFEVAYQDVDGEQRWTTVDSLEEAREARQVIRDRVRIDRALAAAPPFSEVAAELEEALRDREAAEERYNEALVAFEKHPVFVTLATERV